jgi:hypothetical protein
MDTSVSVVERAVFIGLRMSYGEERSQKGWNQIISVGKHSAPILGTLSP